MNRKGKKKKSIYYIYFRFLWGFPHVILIFLLSIHITKTVKPGKKYKPSGCWNWGGALSSSVQAFPEKLLETFADILLLCLFVFKRIIVNIPMSTFAYSSSTLLLGCFFGVGKAVGCYFCVIFWMVINSLGHLEKIKVKLIKSDRNNQELKNTKAKKYYSSCISKHTILRALNKIYTCIFPNTCASFSLCADLKEAVLHELFL